MNTICWGRGVHYYQWNHLVGMLLLWLDLVHLSFVAVQFLKIWFFNSVCFFLGMCFFWICFNNSWCAVFSSWESIAPSLVVFFASPERSLVFFGYYHVKWNRTMKGILFYFFMVSPGIFLVHFLHFSPATVMYHLLNWFFFLFDCFCLIFYHLS